MTRRAGWPLAALALWLQLLLPGATAVAAAPFGFDSVMTLCHGSAPGKDSPAPVHKLCPLCASCGAAHAFLPASPPALPLPRVASRPPQAIGATALPRQAEPPVPRARAPPFVIATFPRPA